MELTYWTSLIEPRSCLKKLAGCDKEEFETYLNGELSINNVDVRNWHTYEGPGRGDYLRLRLAID